MYVILESVENVAGHIKTLWFRPEKPVRYTSGQFTELYLPHDDADGRGIRRWFTLSSSPTEELLGITTRLQPSESSSFKQQLANLKPGARLHLAEPMGDFVLPKDPSIPIFFVAAGLGITPVRSIIKWLHDTGEKRAVKLWFATKPDELAFKQLFQDYKMDFKPITSGSRSKFTAEAIKHATPENSYIYISGPEELVETLYKNAKRLGIDPSRLVADYFPGYPEL
ncbi:MAG: ferredoxin--NADP reductase [Candidatus Saccharimonadales bacterium]